MPKSPKQKLEEFLAALPVYKRKELEQGISSLTQDELNEHIRDLVKNRHPLVDEKYARLLRHDRAKWREYRNREIKQLGKVQAALLPANPVGAPQRVAALAAEAVSLHRGGMNNPQIAAELNKRHGEGTATAESVRKLVLRYSDRT